MRAGEIGSRIECRRLEPQRVRQVAERQIERPGDPCPLDTDAVRVDRRRSRSDAEPADHVRRDVALILIEVAEVDQVPRRRLIENSLFTQRRCVLCYRLRIRSSVANLQAARSQSNALNTKLGPGTCGAGRLGRTPPAGPGAKAACPARAACQHRLGNFGRNPRAPRVGARGDVQLAGRYPRRVI